MKHQLPQLALAAPWHRVPPLQRRDVTQVSDEIAIVGTLDFFTPIVDEPEAGATAYASPVMVGHNGWSRWWLIFRGQEWLGMVKG